jgi:hypothetical protein
MGKTYDFFPVARVGQMRVIRMNADGSTDDFGACGNCCESPGVICASRSTDDISNTFRSTVFEQIFKASGEFGMGDMGMSVNPLGQLRHDAIL